MSEIGRDGTDYVPDNSASQEDETEGADYFLEVERQEQMKLEQAPDDAEHAALDDEIGTFSGLLLGEDFDSIENTSFTGAELEAIANQLTEIKGTLLTSVTGEQMSRVERRLDDAIQASERVGRKDWLLLFVGSVSSLVLGDLLPRDIAQHLLETVLQALGHLFGW